MSALAAVLLETLSCLGLGAAALRTLRMDTDLTPGEHWMISFAVGFGLLGWLVFPIGVAGYLSQGVLTVLLSAGALAAVLLRRPGAQFTVPRVDAVGRVLFVLIAAAAAFDLMEGVAPPADADTLAYQFVTPKQFLEAERIHFIPRAIEGTVPFLVQMTYVPAMALGGETAATLWAMLSGWAAAALLFVLCRPHLGLNWSLTATLIFLTTPAVIYGAGTGQVETRIALFVMLAAWATVRAVETGQAKYAVLAGLGAGFFVAVKYTGLLFAAVAGVVMAVQRRWLVHGAVFSVAVLAAGFQWYAWNGVNTGDPVFPMLFQWLGRDDLVFWTKAHDLFFKELYFRAENPLPDSPFNVLTYPFRATLFFHSVPDAGRVGLGPYGLLVLPFAAMGLWRNRQRVRRNPLLIYASLAFLFYVLWFFAGGSQRIRHLVPVLPLFLICVTAAAVRLTAEGKFLKPLVAATAITLILQMAGHGVFALNYIKFIAGGADREAFLMRNVNSYFVVPWINAHLKKGDKVFIEARQLRYYLDVPSFFGSFLQAQVELRPGKTDAPTLYRQLRSVGITHMLLNPGTNGGAASYPAPYDLLNRNGCLIRLKRFQGQSVRSRTLPGLASSVETLDMLRLDGESCLK